MIPSPVSGNGPAVLNPVESVLRIRSRAEDALAPRPLCKRHAGYRRRHGGLDPILKVATNTCWPLASVTGRYRSVAS
jgi:hypothetical protein